MAARVDCPQQACPPLPDLSFFEKNFSPEMVEATKFLEPEPSLETAQIIRDLATDKGVLFLSAAEEKDILPGAFRWTGTVSMGKLRGLNTAGLANLNAAGCAQFSQLSFHAIRRVLGNRPIAVVNLRAEDQVFIEPEHGKGAIACSYLMKMKWWEEAHRSVEEIDLSEHERMRSLQHRTITVYGIKDAKEMLKDAHIVAYKVSIKAKALFTEQELVESENCSLYLRIPDSKFGPLQFSHIDAFRAFAETCLQKPYSSCTAIEDSVERLCL